MSPYTLRRVPREVAEEHTGFVVTILTIDWDGPFSGSVIGRPLSFGEDPKGEKSLLLLADGAGWLPAQVPNRPAARVRE